ncbi:hypothetical protein QAD02_020636 [Eretmocerus hayati]|uniref:Uncharacterized protein n=1 Tax=Eretmocerus hayati TaxID=131215 RepID=A0ACC2PNZ6_9HYME|nr:hypothetical protein QAD02_020636 [Eretmocerus hayati]
MPQALKLEQRTCGDSHIGASSHGSMLLSPRLLLLFASDSILTAGALTNPIHFAASALLCIGAKEFDYGAILIFEKISSHSTTNYWECKTKGCSAKAYSFNNGPLYGEEEAHNKALCLPQPEKGEEILMHEFLMRTMEEHYQKPEEAYEIAAALFPDAAMRVSKDSKTSRMKRHRLKSFPPCARDYQEFLTQVEEEKHSAILKSLKTGRKITSLVIDDGDDKHVIYYDEDFLKDDMQRTTHLFIDGTFQCRPNIKGSAQVLNIMGLKNGRNSGTGWSLPKILSIFTVWHHLGEPGRIPPVKI